MTLPTILTVACTVIFLVCERAFPGRSLPNVPGWYLRAIAINLAQLGITLMMGRIWNGLFAGASLAQLSSWNMPFLEGLVGWFVGTFVFYWWHRLRHKKGFWQVFHQIHHSPARIEVFTSFYKHPIEIFTNSCIGGIVLFPLLGCSLLGAFWYNFYAATGEYFYHANVSTPPWLRYLIQTPELHSIHHQYDVHAFNYGDIPVWDRIFGTYRDTTEFMPRCGFPEGAEQRLGDMLAFRDVYNTDYAIAVGRSVARPPPHRSRRAVFPHRALQRNSLPHEGQANEAASLVRVRTMIRGRGSWKWTISSWKPRQLKLRRWLRRFSHFHRILTA